MENLTNHSIPLKSSHVAWQMVDGEAVILHISGQVLRGLNAVASYVWERIDGKQTIEKIAQEVSENFSRAEENVLEDVKIFLGELVKKNMVSFSGVVAHEKILL